MSGNKKFEDEETGDICEVPPPPRSMSSQQLPPVNSPPPLLMPQKGSSFRMSVALLDRKSTYDQPRPAPRQRNCALKSTESDLEALDKLRQEIKDSSSVFAHEPISLVTQNLSHPESPHRVLATSAKPPTDVQSVHQLSKVSSPPSRPVPKPRLRAKIPPAQKDNTIPFTSDTAKADHKSETDISFTGSSVDSADKMSAVLEVECNPNYTHPPDQDSLDLMLNEEMDKKYGLEFSSKTWKLDLSTVINEEDQIEQNDFLDYVQPDVFPDILSLAGSSVNSYPEHSKPDMLSLPQAHCVMSSASYIPSVKNSLEKRESLLDYFNMQENFTEAEPATPKPFNILPFKPKLPLTATSDENKAINFDFSDLDPLWQGKQDKGKKPELVSALIDVSETACSTFDNDRLVDPVSSDTYATVDGEDESTRYFQIDRARFSQIDRTFSPEHQLSTVNSRQSSFHYKPPVAPPPPLPREQNRIPIPKAPPVPPRPTNVMTFPQGIISQSISASESVDIFDVSTLKEEIDPFKDTNFDNVCHKFNTNINPPNPLPMAPLINNTETASRPDVDPERISKFVIPPPGTCIKVDNDPRQEYTLSGACLNKKEVEPDILLLKGIAATLGIEISRSTDPMLLGNFLNQFPNLMKDKVIGGGTFGTVFLLKNKVTLDVPYVVKEINIRCKKTFLNEADLLSEIAHERIVPFYGSQITEKIGSLYMTYMTLGSLACDRQPRGESICLMYIGQYLHNRNIHRDIKDIPGYTLPWLSLVKFKRLNILLERIDQIRVTDFGLAKKLQNDQNTFDKGTIRWTAPEVLRGPYGLKADIWSCGCVGIEIFTDVPYPKLENYYQLVMHIGSLSHTPEIPKNISSKFSELLEETLKINPTERKSASQLLGKIFFYPSRNATGRPVGTLESQSGLSRDFSCPNSINHGKYISPLIFREEDLPENYRDSNIVSLIKSVCELTVKLDMLETSPCRPQFWPNSADEYPFFGNKITEPRFGSGMVKRVTLYDSKCPCVTCLQSVEPSKGWGIVEVMTAGHVVYDNDEAKKTRCTFFFEDINSKCTMLDKCELLNIDVEKNWCLFKAVTCNKPLLGRLKKALNIFEKKVQVVHKKYHKSCTKLGFIISHPHGGSKKISLGFLKESVEFEHFWSYYMYDMPTCVGSSGGHVHIVGETVSLWHYPHLHSGALKTGLNQSTVGYKGAQANNRIPGEYTLPEMEEMISSDLKPTDKLECSLSKEIPDSWDYGQLIFTGKMSKIYLMNNLTRKHQTLCVIKESWKMRMDRYQKEYNLLVKMKHDRVIHYFGAIQKGFKLFSVFGHMAFGSVLDFYKKFGPLDEEKSLHFAVQVLEGLQFLHRNNIVHRNIKCKTIMMDKEYKYRISGFYYWHNGPQEISKAVYGSLRWTAPEVFDAKFGEPCGVCGFQSDLWSVGCCLVEMMTADVPYEYIKCDMEVAFEIGGGRPPLPRTKISKKMKEILLNFFSAYAKQRQPADKIIQVLIPHLTESYSSSQDPPEKSIPVCTLKNFPNAIEHNLQWARKKFEKEFHDDTDTAIQYLTDPKFLERTLKLQGTQQLDVLEAVKRVLVDERPQNFEDCVKLARYAFAKNYTNRIKQLLFNFPPDQKTSTGAPFWSGPKHCPTPLEYDSSKETHLDYVVAFANLKAQIYGIPQLRDRNKIKELADKISVPVFQPKSGVKIEVTNSEVASSSNNPESLVSDDLSTVQECLPVPSALSEIKITSLDLEIDDDSNFHMDFIVAASNLRANNYSIPEAD